MSAIKYCISFFIIFVLFHVQVQSQVVINELSSRNATVFTDFDKDYSDWIELWNPGSQAVNLKDWHLSDDITNPGKWSFPEIIIPPDSHLVVFASDKNRKTIVDHWETAIHAENIWKYWIPYAEPDPAWKNLGFDDQNWLEGLGGFGRGDGDDNTILPDTIATVYLRKTFTIPDTSVISFILLQVDYDDAFIAFLNGVEIARTNIGWPGKFHPWNDYSYDVHKAKMYQGLPIEEFPIDLGFFKSIVKEGDNVLAIQALNAWGNHGNFSIIPFLSFGIKDSSFTYQELPEWFGEKPIHFHTNFSLGGEGESIVLSDANSNPVDQVNYPYMHADHSYGRAIDGGPWQYFNHPTPGFANNLSPAASGYAKEPQFSVEAGFYPGSMEIGFLNYQTGDTIRFTIDGSWVNDTSAIYSGDPIILDTTIVLRAQVHKSGLLPGKVISNSYIIGYTSTLPVVSISLNPHDLWDWNEGIYVLGPNASTIYPYHGANYWMDWPKPAHIEYFDEAQNQGFELDADLMIHGGFSRVFPMKSLRVVTDSKYDEQEINYKLFKDKDIQTFNKFVLRNSGQDFNNAHFRDALMQKAVQNGTHNDIQDYQPVVVFLNGQYWGIHNIREKIDRFYVNSNHGVDLDSIHLLRDNIKIVEGNYYQYMQMIEYVINVPVVDSLVYDSISKLVDIENYSDYFISEMYYVNPDWPHHNTKYWRTYADGSKWRYIMTDLDFGLGLYSQTNMNELYRVLHSTIMWSDNHRILRRLMQNADYKWYFINRSADLFNTVLTPQKLVDLIELFKDRLAPEMQVHMPRWGGSYASWESNVQVMTNFAMNRRPYVWQHYLSEFDLNKLVTITLDVDSIAHGRIKMNTIIPDSLPWEGVYFDGNPVEISALPDSGFVFSHWQSNMIISGSDSLNPYLKINVDTNDVFKAFFVPDTAELETPFIIFSEINYRSSDTLNTSDWVELLNLDTAAVDLSGWVFKDGDDDHQYIIQEGTTLDTSAYLLICQDTLAFRQIHPEIAGIEGPFEFGLAATGENLRLFDADGNLITSVFYSNQSPWSPDADGTGRTLELADPYGDLNSGSNWFAGCIGGSPGGPFAECDTIGINEFAQGTDQVRIYPNPSSTNITVEVLSANGEDVILSIIDPWGSLVYHSHHKLSPIIRNKISIDISELEPGVYFFSVKGSAISYTTKIIVL